MFKPASDWVDAFPEEPNDSSKIPPPARPRTRKAPVERAPEPEPPIAPRPAPEPRLPYPRSGIDAAPSANEKEASSYSVGYKKPPHHTRFKPGQSGNAKGRPKRAASLNTIVRANLTSKVAVRTPDGEKKITRIEAVIHKAVEQAMKGNPRAIAELLKLYASAVPEERTDDSAPGRDKDLTAADLAMLEAYRFQLGHQQREQP